MAKDKQKTISITEARKRIFDLADDVQKPDSHYLLTERGRAKAVILSAREYESLRETVDVLREMPYIERDMTETEKDIKTGAYKKYMALDDLLAKEGYIKVTRRKTHGKTRSAYKAKGGKRTK